MIKKTIWLVLAVLVSHLVSAQTNGGHIAGETASQDGVKFVLRFAYEGLAEGTTPVILGGRLQNVLHTH